MSPKLNPQPAPGFEPGIVQVSRLPNPLSQSHQVLNSKFKLCPKLCYVSSQLFLARSSFTHLICAYVSRRELLRPMKLSGGFPRAGDMLLHRDAQSAAGRLRYTSGLADHQPSLLSGAGIIFLRKTPIYFSRKKHSPRGKDFKMTCITTASPSSSSRGGGNFSSHAKHFAGFGDFSPS